MIKITKEQMDQTYLDVAGLRGRCMIVDGEPYSIGWFYFPKMVVEAYANYDMWNGSVHISTRIGEYDELAGRTLVKHRDETDIDLNSAESIAFELTPEELREWAHRTMGDKLPEVIEEVLEEL